MKKTNYLFLFFVIPFLFINCKNENGVKSEIESKNALSSEESDSIKEPTLEEKIAQASGFKNFDEVSQLNFTFNVKVNDSIRTQRSWKWNLKTDEVSLTVNDSTTTYNSKTEAKNHAEIDQKFINDQYWLLFPFHLVMDELDFEAKGKAPAPISGDTLQKAVVTYPSDAGYTPGDVYEIYFDDTYMIKEWVYRSGGNKENAFPATWEAYKEFGDLKISTMHQNKDKSFQLYFTGIEVK